MAPETQVPTRSPGDIDSDGRPSHHAPLVVAGDVVLRVEPVAPSTPCEAVADLFASDRTLIVQPVVTAEGTAVGLINRFHLLESLSHRFGRALLLRRPAGDCVHGKAMVFDEHVPLDVVATQLVAESSTELIHGFVVTASGCYLGIGTSVDVMRALTDRKHAELLRLAHHDFLTGLPNRHLFDRRLGQAMDSAARAGRRVAVLFVDLDRFKRINDTYGHMVGDLVLRSVGERLRSSVRADDIVARLGGDEFAIILAEADDPSTTDLIARRVVHTCAAPIAVDGHEVIASCSVGVAVFPDDAGSVPGVVRAADAAVYHAKQARNTWQRYRREMQRVVVPPALSPSALRRALEEQQLHVVYQPIFSLKDARVSCVEALVRWRHPTISHVAADQLISLAEDCGLIVQVSEFVMREAICEIQACDRAVGHANLRLAINISGVQIHEGGLVRMLAAVLRDTGFDPTRLELELTESTAMRDGPGVMATLEGLKGLGCRLAIDDFGTGFSALSRLESLPVDILKIDRSFVRGIDGPQQGGAIARAILAMCQSLDLVSVAEGVECDAQMGFLRSHGCDYAQGFLLARPMSLDSLSALLLRTSGSGVGAPLCAV
jgi:diguanylate cyclase (GGDEF)-like protein